MTLATMSTEAHAVKLHLGVVMLCFAKRPHQCRHFWPSLGYFPVPSKPHHALVFFQSGQGVIL